MPLLLTPAQPLITATGQPIEQVYAIITDVAYKTREKRITYVVGYYVNEQAYFDKLLDLQLSGVRNSFSQEATPQQANAVGIFDFLEAALTQQLTQLLGEGATIENVP